MKKLIPAAIAVFFSASLIIQMATTEAATAPKVATTTTSVAVGPPPTPPTTVVPTTTTVKPKPKPKPKHTVAYIVNRLPYNHSDMVPVMKAFHLVAASRHWTKAQIASWDIAVHDIALKEAGACWNVRYGAKFLHWDGRGCILKHQGRGSSGFGQLTKVALGGPCRRVGICTELAVVASPYNSMAALVALIEESGVRPWCYNGYARRFHRVACSNPGLDVP